MTPLRTGREATIGLDVVSDAGFGDDLPAYVLLAPATPLTVRSSTAVRIGIGDRWDIEIRAWVPPTVAPGTYRLMMCVSDLRGGLGCSATSVVIGSAVRPAELGVEQPPIVDASSSGARTADLVLLPATSTTGWRLPTLLTLALTLLCLGASAFHRARRSAPMPAPAPPPAPRTITLRLDGRPVR